LNEEIIKRRGVSERDLDALEAEDQRGSFGEWGDLEWNGQGRGTRRGGPLCWVVIFKVIFHSGLGPDGDEVIEATMIRQVCRSGIGGWLATEHRNHFNFFRVGGN
jgi:hypothetical protein